MQLDPYNVIIMSTELWIWLHMRICSRKIEVHDRVHVLLDQMEVELLTQFGFLESVFVVRQH